MNKFLTKVTALCVGLAMVAGVGVAVGSKSVGEAKAADDIEITFPGSPSQKTSSYSKTFTMTVGGVEFSFANWNNGSASDSWDAIRGGQKSSAWTGTITSGLIANTVEKVEVNITSVSNSTGSKLEVASDASFTQNVQTIDHGSITATGKATFTVPNQVENSYYRLTFNQSAKANGSIRLDSVKYYAGASTSNPAITLNPSNLSFMSNGSSQNVTVVPNDQFTGTPTISVSGTPSYVNCSVNGLTITVSPKAIGTESITINAVNNTEQASATLSVEVIDAHGHAEDDPFSVAEVRSLIDEDTSKTHSSVYVEGIVSQVDSYNSSYKSITYWISDDGTTTNQFECYSGKGIASADFSSVNDVEVGASVVVCGDAKYYSGTYEFNYNNYLVSYTAPTSSPLSSISLSGTHATSFDVGDTFSYAGLVVTAHYEDTSSKTVTPTSVSSPDMSSAGQKTVTVTYTENEVSKNASYTITVNAVTYHTISFLPGEGSGTHDSVQAKDGSDYVLPTTTTFTAPEGKVFDHWEFNDVEITIIESIDEDVEVVAIYTDAPSEVEATMTAGTNGSAAVVIADEVENAAIKVGTSSKGGDMTLTVGAGAKYVKFYAAAWKGVTGLSLNIAGAETDPTSVALNADDGISNSSPFTLAGNAGDFLFTVNLTGISEETVLTLTTSTTKRFVLWGAVYGTNGSPEPEKVLTGISVSGAKDSFLVNDEFVTTGLVVTAHYQDSPDATISSGYEVDSSSVDNTKAGEYTITVSYGGFDDTYIVTYSEPAPVETKTYKKVKTNLANFAGDYLIVYEEGSVAFDGSLENPDVSSNTFAVSITDEAISASEAYEFTVAKKEGGYSLKSASGLYIGKTANSNGMDKNASDNYTNTISYFGTEESDMDIVGSGLPHLRYNASSGQERFRFFKSDSYTNQKAVSLYIEVANDAEALALDILNETSPICSAEHDSSSFASVWASLGTKFEALGSEKSVLVEGDADANGTFVAEALARYDLIVGRYGLEGFITDRVASSSYIPVHESSIDASNSVTVIVIVAVTSMTLLGVTLVLRKRKHQ